MRKLIPLLLALMLLAATLPLAGLADTTQDPITVSVFVGEARDQPTSDNKIFKMIEDEFGMKFEFEFLAGDLRETLGIKIAGQDYADLMDGGNSEVLIEAGAFIDLMPYITPETTPNLYEYLEPHLGRLLNDEGQLFVLPNYGRYYNTQGYGYNYVNGPAFFVQKQVLAWDNYPQIKTLDEYFDLLERFITANPTDKNGSPYTGFAILCDGWRAFCLFNPVQHLMGRPNDGDVIVDIDDNYGVDAYVIQPYAKHYYKKLNEFYHKGYISQDTFVMNYDQYIAKISSGTVLGMFDQTWNFQIAIDALNTANMEENTYQGLPIVFDPHYVDGREIEEHYLNGTVINVNRGFGITVNCKDPERMIAMFERMLDDDWQKTFAWGIEGEDHYVENGRLLRTEEQRDNAGNAVWRNANTARALYESLPKKQGIMDDGNYWDPNRQPEIYFDLMRDYDKEFLNAYGYKIPLDFFNPPIQIAPYGEAWQIDTTVNQDADDSKIAFQDTQRRDLPQIIMADEADFDAKWDEFVANVEAIPISDFVDFMQAEVLKLVERNTN